MCIELENVTSIHVVRLAVFDNFTGAGVCDNECKQLHLHSVRLSYIIVTADRKQYRISELLTR